MRTVHSFQRASLGALFAIALAPLGAAGGGTSASVAGAAAPTQILSGQNDRMVLFPIRERTLAETRALRVRPVGSADPAYKIQVSEPLAPTARYLSPRESAIICLAARPVGRICERLEADQQPMVEKHVMPARSAAYLRLVLSGLIDVEDPTPARADLLKHDMSARHIAILRADMAVGTPDTGDKSFTGYTLFGAAKPADPLQVLAQVRLRPGQRADIELAVPVEWFEADPVLVLLARHGG